MVKLWAEENVYLSQDQNLHSEPFISFKESFYLFNFITIISIIVLPSLFFLCFLKSIFHAKWIQHSSMLPLLKTQYHHQLSLVFPRRDEKWKYTNSGGAETEMKIFTRLSIVKREILMSMTSVTIFHFPSHLTFACWRLLLTTRREREENETKNTSF